MPADTMMEKVSVSPVAAVTACNSIPEKSKTASEHRKSSKPIMEKRRRARINESLGHLKTLILDALKKDSSRHSKLEKADILEMTVKHLRNLQRVQMTAALNTDPSVLGKYRAGFNECMTEVTRFLSTCEGVNAEVRTRLLSHLANCMAQISTMSGGYPQGHHHGPAGMMPPPPPPPPSHYAQAIPTGAPGGQVPVASNASGGGAGAAAAGGGGGTAGVALPGGGGGGGPACKGSPPALADVLLSQTAAGPASNVGAGKVYGGFHLVPGPDGQIAFLIPNPHLIPMYAPGSSAGSPGHPGSPGKGLLHHPYPTGCPMTASAIPINALMGADSVWRPW